MSNENKLDLLINKDLTGFKIIEMTEVYRVDVDGRKNSSLGFFKDSDIASLFAGAQTDSNYLKTDKALVLTDGNVGYLVNQQESIKFFDEEKETLTLKQNALNKLSPAEKRLLGIE